MHRGYVLPLILLLLAALAACGGSTATDTAQPATPTTAPTIAAAGSAIAATRPAGSVVAASGAAPTSAPTTAVGSAARGTLPASSALTGPVTTPAGATVSASAVAGTRPAGSATTGSVTAGSGTAAAGSSVAVASPTVFTDPQGRFSFSRPAAWTIGQSTSPGSVVQFNSANPPGVVDVSTESVSANVAADRYLDAALAEIKKQIPDAQQVGTLSLRLDTEPAIQLDYTGTVSGTKIYFSQIFAIHKGTAYVLTLGTQPADIDRMKQAAVVVVQTWKFLQ